MSTPTSTRASLRYMLTFYAPPTHLEQCLEACFLAGAGIWPLSSAFMASDSPSSSPNSSSVPLYENCAFVTSGRGQFRPTAAANPHSGRPGETEHLDEQRVEMMIGDSEEQNGEQVMRRVVARLRAVHPYEVVAMAVVRIEDV